MHTNFPIYGTHLQVLLRLKCIFVCFFGGGKRAFSASPQSAGWAAAGGR